MPRGINQVEFVGVSIRGGIVEFDSGRFNCDTAFTFQIHQIKHLFAHLTVSECVGMLKKSIAERAFPVINMP